MQIKPGPHITAGGRTPQTAVPAPQPDVQIRCLDDYDVALGLQADLGGGVA